MSNETSDIEIQLQGLKIAKKKNNYQIVTKEIKDQAIFMLGDNPRMRDYQIVSEQFRISIKNLRRWLLKGTERKKGCGRKKINPQAETQLVKWVIDQIKQTGRKVSRSELKLKALELIGDNKFQASKGFLDKFVRNHGLKFIMLSALINKQQICFLNEEEIKIEVEDTTN